MALRAGDPPPTHVHSRLLADAARRQRHLFALREIYRSDFRLPRGAAMPTAPSTRGEGGSAPGLSSSIAGNLSKGLYPFALYCAQEIWICLGPYETITDPFCLRIDWLPSSFPTYLF
jgi:hypothetical protein